MRASWPLLAGMMLCAPAWAFQGDRSQPSDVGSTVLDRARFDPAVQAALTARPEWRHFLAGHPGPWRVVWDERAGTPRSIIGGEIPLVSPDAGASEVERGSRAFLATLEPLSGVSDGLLQTRVLTRVHETWFVRFDRVTPEGTPVLGAYAELRIIKGAVVLIRLETHPQAEARLPGLLQAAEARQAAHVALSRWVGPASLTSTAREVVVPVADGSRYRYQPAFEVTTAIGRGPQAWKTVVDARSGAVLSRESLIRYAQVTGMVEPRTVGDPLTSEGFSFEQISGASAATTDSAGNYAVGAAPGASSSALAGSRVSISNMGGAGATLSFNSSTNPSPVWSVGGPGVGNADQAQLDAYFHASTVRIWATHAYLNPADAPSSLTAWLAAPLTYNVNDPSHCNSFWDGTSVTLYSAGNGCNNTAQIADVVFHETGHGIHQNNLVSGIIDGTVGEGSADFFSAQITGDPRIGPGFFQTQTPSWIRDLSQLLVYPADLSGEIHHDGQIWGGSMWQLRSLLISKYGDAGGRAKTSDIFLKALQAGPTIDQTYQEVILGDGPGTPDQCEIDSAFGVHGLVSGAALAPIHSEVLGPIPAGQAVTINATKPVQSGTVCPGTAIAAIDLLYTVDNGVIQTVTLTSGAGGAFSGQIPAQAAGHDVRYWLSATLSGGNKVTNPINAPANTFAYYVGPVFTVWKDDFETDKGWTHGGTLDDWNRGTPNGQGFDAGAAYSPSHAFGNDVGGAGFYQDNADNWALSPVIDCRGCKGARIQLRRWLSVEDATYDHARLLIDNGDGQRHVVYENPVGAGNGGALPKDLIWQLEDYDVSPLVDGNQVKIRFELSSDAGAHYGGWTVDDVAIVTPAQPGPAPSGGHGCGCDLVSGAEPLPGVILLALLAVVLLAWRHVGERSAEGVAGSGRLQAGDRRAQG